MAPVAGAPHWRHTLTSPMQPTLLAKSYSSSSRGNEPHHIPHAVVPPAHLKRLSLMNQLKVAGVESLLPDVSAALTWKT